MDVTPNGPAGRQVIEAYGADGFRIGGRRFAGSVIVCPQRTLAWTVERPEAIALESLRPVIDAVPKVVVPVHYSTWPLIEQDAEAWAKRVEAESDSKCVVMQPGDSLSV